MAIPVFATGDVPTADQVNKWFVNTRFARKPGIETVSSSATLQNDDDLFLSVDAGAMYLVNCVLFIASQTNADFQLDFTAPSGATFAWTATAINQAGTQITDLYQGAYGIGSAPPSGGLGGVTAVTRIEGLYVGGANAGTLRLRWAQNTLQASGTSVLTNSWIYARQVS